MSIHVDWIYKLNEERHGTHLNILLQFSESLFHQIRIKAQTDLQKTAAAGNKKYDIHVF